MGGGGDTAIDALAIIVNNVMITDVDTVNELAEQNGRLDVSFIFIQAERTSGFDASKIGDFGFGVRDFFNPEPKIKRNAEIKGAVELANSVFTHAAILRRPSCQLYYVTTGKWQDDPDFVARRDAVSGDLAALGMFGSIRFDCSGAEELHGAYSQTKNAVTRVFDFKYRSDLPVSEGVNQAFIGYVPFSQFRAIINDDSGTEILSSIFYDNVRDWQEYNLVNKSMKEHGTRSQRELIRIHEQWCDHYCKIDNPIGSKFTISDFQIVNGCQTSNVLFFDQRDVIDDLNALPCASSRLAMRR